MQLDVGNVIDGKVTGITKFGAFVELPNGKTGLVHISEVAAEYVNDIKDHLKENQKVTVKILTIDKDGKISLSIKRALPTPKIKPFNKPADIDWHKKNVPDNLCFEDKMSRFKQDSNERMQDLKKYMESKRGGGFKKSMHPYSGT